MDRWQSSERVMKPLKSSDWKPGWSLADIITSGSHLWNTRKYLNLCLFLSAHTVNTWSAVLTAELGRVVVIWGGWQKEEMQEVQREASQIWPPYCEKECNTEGWGRQCPGKHGVTCQFTVGKSDKNENPRCYEPLLQIYKDFWKASYVNTSMMKIYLLCLMSFICFILCFGRWPRFVFLWCAKK